MTSDYFPKEFKVRSMNPELSIRYLDSLWGRVLFFLILTPFAALFLAHCVILFLAMKSLLSLNFRELFYTVGYSTDNPLHVLTFVFTFLLLGGASWYGLGAALTTTELRATNEEILITYNTVWRSRKVSIPSNDIAYFHQFLKHDSVAGGRWELEVVTNRRLSRTSRSLPTWVSKRQGAKAVEIRLNYRVVNLFSSSRRSPVEWLGNVLAEFYEESRGVSLVRSDITIEPETKPEG